MEEKNEQAQKEVKKSKKTLLIVIIVILVLGALIAILFVSGAFKTKDVPKDTGTKEEIKKEEEQTPPEKVPATNTE